MDLDPGKVLSEARRDFQQKKYRCSLEKYKWFYNNALKYDQAYYGVRLSYCINEWAGLCKVFEPAGDALREEMSVALETFIDSHSLEAFHEYSSIAESLGEEASAYKNFILVHESNRKLAHEIFMFVYPYCAKNERWELCREYLGDGYKQYTKVLELFDYMLDYSVAEGGDSVQETGHENFKQGCMWLLRMLHASGDKINYSKTLLSIESDLRERDQLHLFDEILYCAPEPTNNP